ncbi:hypothetical protein N9Y54_00240 [Alphaproteobacteria bacterium]|jgi:hypothetical protein|nr:hypothetical protein [Alphaproteobacteria bacterium]|tara:strand:+ start:1272 stop:1469 length:198 start_codon:yes stop_codon:yes gene_type:complete
MSESCKYCESELSTMDAVYIESEIHSSPQKIQNMISTYHNMVCYNCFKKLKNMRVIPQAKKTKEK